MADKKQTASPVSGSKVAPPEVELAMLAKKKAERGESFRRLAIKRVNKAIKAIELVGNLANYKPSLEQAASIEGALVKAHNNTVERLKGTAKTIGSFSL